MALLAAAAVSRGSVEVPSLSAPEFVASPLLARAARVAVLWPSGNVTALGQGGRVLARASGLSEATVAQLKKKRPKYSFDVDETHAQPASQQRREASPAALLLLVVLASLVRRAMTKGGDIGTVADRARLPSMRDVVACEDQKQAVWEFVDFLQNKAAYEARGAKVPRGALLHGPPGTGKTLLAKAVAAEADAAFLYASGADFAELYVGVGPSRVRSLFARARKLAPCIVFIDEIDAVGRKRGSAGGGGGAAERDATLNALLVELDGFGSTRGEVLVFAATNRVDVLDPALRRPGRFDREIAFTLPERGERALVFEHYLAPTLAEAAEDMAACGLGLSYADIASVCNEACILSVREGASLARTHLDAAVTNVTVGHERSSCRLGAAERRVVAVHEAGHALLAHLLPDAPPPVQVSIVPRGVAGLGFTQSAVPDGKLQTPAQVRARICVLMGGRVAEQLLTGSCTTGAADDIEKATALAYRYVADLGFAGAFFQYRRARTGERERDKVDTAVQQLLADEYARAETTLGGDARAALERLARTVESAEVLRGKALIAALPAQ